MITSSLSGLQAAGLRLATAAHNTANLNTPGARAQRVAQTEQARLGGTRAEVRTSESEPDLATETVEQISAGHAFRASAAMIRAQNEQLGTVLDLLA